MRKLAEAVTPVSRVYYVSGFFTIHTNRLIFKVPIYYTVSRRNRQSLLSGQTGNMRRSQCNGTISKGNSCVRRRQSFRRRGALLAGTRASRAWVYRWKVNGKHKELGLGATAIRTLARALRKAITEGRDPALVLHPEAEKPPLTFQEIARDCQDITPQLANLHNWFKEHGMEVAKTGTLA